MKERKKESKEESKEGSIEALGNQTSLIKNKIQRSIAYNKLKKEKEKEKSFNRKKRKREAEKLGKDAPPRKIPRTLDNTREPDETIVLPDDQEVIDDDATDEFSQYFTGKTPKLLITTSPKPTYRHKAFISDLTRVFPNAHYYYRSQHTIKFIVEFAKKKNFTDIILTHEDCKRIHGMLLIHLPEGPTAYFKLSSVQLCKEISRHASKTEHRPELVLNRFTTRLGHTIGRMFASLFHQKPEFRGRQVATFHNQRDFIFFRHHRYIVEEKKKGEEEKGEPVARIQEMGPRFSLKLRSLQLGTFDPIYGEYVWMHKKELDTSRRRFHI